MNSAVRRRVTFLAAMLFALPRPLPAETVALAPFSHVGYRFTDRRVDDANLDLLVGAMGASTSYTLVERSRIDRVIAEQALNSMGAVRGDSAIQLGRLLRADVILTGQFFNPGDRPAFVVLEAVEAARAEVVAHAQVPLSAAFAQKPLAPLCAADVATISQRAGPLLTEAFAAIAARPQQVLIKFLAVPNLCEDPAYQRLGKRLESELRRRAARSPSQRLLGTDRAEIATEESELRLLGLVDSDISRDQLADYYLWGQCNQWVLHLTLWDGRSAPTELDLPLPSNPYALDTAITAACDAILAATRRPVRLIPPDFSTERQRKEIARQLRAFAAKLDSPMNPNAYLQEVARLLTAAIFFDPAAMAPWLRLERQRSRLSHVDAFRADAERITSRLWLRSRFIVDDRGAIQSEALFASRDSDRGCLLGLFADLTGTGIARTANCTADQIREMQELWHRVVAEVGVETARAAEQLARAAPGQEEDFRNAAESIMADVFQPALPRWCYTPDPVRTQRIVDLLAPRWKIGEARFFSWNLRVEAPKDLRFDPLGTLEQFLCSRGRVADARKLSVLNPDELAQALATVPLSSKAMEALETAQNLAGTGDQRHGAEYQSIYEVLRRRGELALRARSSEPFDSRAAIAELLSSTQLPPLSNAIGGAPSSLTPDGAFFAADAQDFPRLARCLHEMRGMDLARGEGLAFVRAIEHHKWLVVDYLLQQGLDERAASWPAADDYQSKEALGVVALAQAVVHNRLDLADRLTRHGVRFRADSALGDWAIEEMLRRRDVESLKRLLAAGAISTGKNRCLAAAVEAEDLSLLGLLVDAGADVTAPLTNVEEQWGEVDRVVGNVKKSTRNALCYAGLRGWSAGVEAMLAAPSFRSKAVYDESMPFEDWPHQLTADPAMKSLLLRATLSAAWPQANREAAAGIELFCAIAAGKLDQVTSSWRKPGAQNFAVASQSPLIFAVREERAEIARWLVLNGAAVNAVDGLGNTALGYAAVAGNTPLVRLLVSKGAAIDVGSETQGAPLIRAIRAGHEETALALIAAHASVRARRAKAEDDPLFEAVKYDMVTVVDRLIAAGADPLVSYAAANILFPAARSNDPALIQRFVSLGCKPVVLGSDPSSPLDAAIAYGAARSTAKLLALGVRDPAATARAESSFRLSLTLGYVADEPSRPRHYQPDLAQCLVLMSKYGQVSPFDYRDPTVMHFGSWMDRFLTNIGDKSPEEIRAFLAAGGSLNAYVGVAYFQHMLPFADAVRRGDIEQLKVLLELDPKIARPTSVRTAAELDTETPLVSAAHKREPIKYELMRLLIEHGAQADARSRHGEPTVLFKALSNRPSPATVRLLLDHGAPIDDQAAKAFADLVSSDPLQVLKIEEVLRPDEIRLFRGGTR